MFQDIIPQTFYFIVIGPDKGQLVTDHGLVFGTKLARMAQYPFVGAQGGILPEFTGAENDFPVLARQSRFYLHPGPEECAGCGGSLQGLAAAFEHFVHELGFTAETGLDQLGKQLFQFAFFRFF